MNHTLFYLVRHGTTTDSNKGIIRGDRDSMLDRQGFLDAHKLKSFFRNRPFDNIYTSDMTRSIQTGRVVAEPHGKQPLPPIHNLRPWDVGYLTGKDKKMFGKDVTVFVENPDMRPRGGETRNEFFARVNPILREAIQMGVKGVPNIIIGHSSIIHALAHLLWGEEHPPLAVKPGGVIEVFVNDKGDIDARELYKKGQDDSSFAGGKQPTS